MYKNNQYHEKTTSIELEKYSKNMNKIKHAENIMKNMYASRITSNQIRIILSIFVNIKNKINLSATEQLNDEYKATIQYAKAKVMYQISRTNSKKFYGDSYIGLMLDDIDTKTDYDNFIKYIEALVAFQKFYGKN